MPTDFANGFEEQLGGLHIESSWMCGTYSFAHVMLLHGIPMEIDVAKRMCRTVTLGDRIPYYSTHPSETVRMLLTWNDSKGGTSAADIATAAERGGFRADFVRERQKDKAKCKLEAQLREHHPTILSVKEGRHWAVAAGLYDDKILIIDSNPGSNGRPNVMSLCSWGQLERYWRMVCERCEGDEAIACEKCDGVGGNRCGWCNGRGCGHCGDSGSLECSDCKGKGKLACPKCNGNPISYEGITILTKRYNKETESTLRNILKLAPTLMKNEFLRTWWGFYLSRLYEVFPASSSGFKAPIQAKEFFDRFGQNYMEEAAKWVNGITNREVSDELQNFRTVAEAYKLRLARADLEQKLIAFGTIFTSMLWEQY
jgi:hypothetical protein